jgi:hypothetical protein
MSEETELDGLMVGWQKTEDSEESWILWRSTGSTFEARCRAADLPRALDASRELVNTCRVR